VSTALWSRSVKVEEEERGRRKEERRREERKEGEVPLCE
jgi:hypothetical protein